MEEVIFHVDVNSAFLSWEAVNRLQQGDTLDLREIPSAVAGDKNKRHGIILAKSTPAKQYGVQKGEQKREKLDQAIDKIRDRFGSTAIQRASLVKKETDHKR